MSFYEREYVRRLYRMKLSDLMQVRTAANNLYFGRPALFGVADKGALSPDAMLAIEYVSMGGPERKRQRNSSLANKALLDRMAEGATVKKRRVSLPATE